MIKFLFKLIGKIIKFIFKLTPLGCLFKLAFLGLIIWALFKFVIV